MASKNDKTSKTARVMNLLSKKPDPASGEAAEGSVPPIVSSMVPDAEVSAQIKNALEDTLEGELSPAPAPQPEPEPVQQAAPSPAPQPEPQPVQQAAPAPQPEPQPVQQGRHTPT